VRKGISTKREGQDGILTMKKNEIGKRRQKIKNRDRKEDGLENGA
jgi:hypothetical protein